MKKIIKLLIICISTVSVTFGQDAGSTVFEKGPNDMIRFYYDNDYYLVDKNCEFKYIERVAGFDISTNKFDGPFKDFDNFGRTVLSGSYVKGNKEGDFSAYYPDGKLKWEATFVNNEPQGRVNYFYPDGKLLMSLTVYKENTYINQFWNREGKQMVTDGQGTIDINLPIIGFTEHGFTKYNTKGKVENGLQQGLWYTSMIKEGKKTELIPLMTSSYQNSLLRNREVNDYFKPLLINFNEFAYAPVESFPTAELLQSKQCSFDEHTGFNSFIANKFANHLLKIEYFPEQDEKLTLTYTVSVSKSGVPFGPRITHMSKKLSREEKFIYEDMINKINYYLPSYINNKSINDRLNISFQVQINGQQIFIAPVQIVREKGF